MARRSHPPAWYPDPRDTRLLRRWDGSHWTQDVKPYAEWLRSLHLAPGPVHRRVPSAQRSLWTTSALLLAAALALALLVRSDQAIPPARIDDASFVESAIVVCASGDRHLLPRDGATARRADPAHVRSISAGLAEVAHQLRALPVAPPARRAVWRWLEAWDAAASSGVAFADAAEGGDEAAAAAAARAMAEAWSTIDRIAYLNGIHSCIAGTR